MLRQLQDEQRPWVQHNFGDRPSWWPLLGVMEELGELAHAHLKKAQGIRTNEDHDAKAADAVADIVIFLADYCSAVGIDLESVVRDTWAEVRTRDWRANPANADTANGLRENRGERLTSTPHAGGEEPDMDPLIDVRITIMRPFWRTLRARLAGAFKVSRSGGRSV